MKGIVIKCHQKMHIQFRWHNIVDHHLEEKGHLFFDDSFLPTAFFSIGLIVEIQMPIMTDIYVR
jgi:hypothetical protein